MNTKKDRESWSQVDRDEEQRLVDIGEVTELPCGCHGAAEDLWNSVFTLCPECGAEIE